MEATIRHRLWIVALLICIACYWSGLAGPLVFDSKVALEKNPDFHFDPSRFNEWRIAVDSSAAGPTGRPVSMLSLALNYALLGSVEPFWFKFTNLILHCLIGTLIYMLLDRLRASSVDWRSTLGESPALPLFASAIWLLHPLQLSSVLYVVQRMEQLSAFFTVAGLLVWVSYRRHWLDRMPRSDEVSRCLAWLAACLAMAVMSKEDGVLLLPLLVLVELFFFRLVFGGQQQRWLLLGAYGGIALGLVLFILWTIWTPSWIAGLYSSREFTLGERLLTQLRVLWQYLGWILVPDIRAMALHHDALEVSTSLLQPGTTAVAAAAWLAVAASLALGWRRFPVFNFSMAWFLLAHLLESSLLPLEMSYEHRNYLPLLGPALWLAWMVLEALPRLVTRQRAVLALILLVVLGAQLLQRSVIWHDEERMSAYHLRHHPGSARSIYHYANTQLRRGESSSVQAQQQSYIGRARVYYEHILEIRPDDLAALVTLLYLDSRYFPKADAERWASELEVAALKPVLSFADRNALGLLQECMLTQLCTLSPERYRDLLARMAQAHPGDAMYPEMLAVYAGRADQDFVTAARFHEQTLMDSPGNLNAHQNLIALYQISGQRREAIELMQQMLVVDDGIPVIYRIGEMLELE